MPCMNASTSKDKSKAKPETPTLDRIIKARHVQWVKEQVAQAGSASRAARGMRMSEEEIQKVLDENP